MCVCVCVLACVHVSRNNFCFPSDTILNHLKMHRHGNKRPLKQMF